MVTRKMLAGIAAALAGPIVVLAQVGPQVPAPTTGPAPQSERPAFGPGPGAIINADTEVLDAMKKQLTVSDEEWKVIGPALKKVLVARRLVDTGTAADANSFRVGLLVLDLFGGPGGSRNSFAGPGDAAGVGGGPGGRRGPGGGPGFGPPGAPTTQGGATTQGGGPPGGFGPGGPGGPGGRRPRGGGVPGFGSNAVTQAVAELQQALADPKSTPEFIQEKVANVRHIRATARQDLEAAEKELIELLTLDQEATLASAGVID